MAHQPTMTTKDNSAGNNDDDGNGIKAAAAAAAIVNPYLRNDTSAAFSNDVYNDISTSEPDAKRHKVAATTATRKRSPTSFVTWNCNGFSSRANWDRSELQRLLKETDYPDMICIQEARLKANNSAQRGRPTPSDSSAVQKALEEVFRDYRPHWSLADKKYAGTLTLIHKRLGNTDGDGINVCKMAFSFNSSIDVLLQRFSLTREEAGLKDQPAQKKGPSASPQNNKKQKTLMSFFSPKMKTATNSSSSNTGNTGNKATKFDRDHHPEGRIQFFSFESIDILQTYVPNNGTKEESFAKRRDWDEQILQFVLDRKQILQGCGQSQRPMLWCGDMNVAHDYRDGTHWRNEGDNDDDDDNENHDRIYEWWTDEEKCFVRGVKKSSTYTDAQQQKHADNVGIPSFTAGERRRFKDILLNGDFVDVWRARYPTGVDPKEGRTSHQKQLFKANPWDRPNYTWRGHLAKPGSQYPAKYQGKGQRLDYFLLSPKDNMLPLVEYCEILGYGEQREGLFCGSDHCASLLRLKEE